ncbi:MAG: recombinase family protein [Clostridia bacterium]|nr:recombinase family protein [Clostridia bacterium]
MAKNITVIPATRNQHTGIPTMTKYKRRVAGYARVSTDSEEQQTSYEAQVDYYTQYIRSKPEWQFVEVYTDEGISATNTKKRDGFNRMIQDALDGKIDLILTKSVSRFARNTVDSLTTVRKLKDAGVEVYFEKENIWTLDSKGELLITIMSSLAQEESRSISENVTWGQRKRFADGKVTMPYRSFLGYRKGADGTPEIIPDEAAIVKRIYALFMQGKTTGAIARILTAEGIPTPGGKQKWAVSTIESILKNEKYRGDAILQKTFTVDFLQKKMKPNEGEVPQYYVQNSHPAIIEPAEWDLVQAEMARRKELKQRYSSHSVFASMIFCGECGGYYGSKVWHSTDKYRRVIWQCSDKFKGDHRCGTPHLTESQIQELFLQAFGKVVSLRDIILEDCRLVQKELFDCTELDRQQQTLEEEMRMAADMVRHCIEENALKVQDQTEYLQRYEQYTRHYEKLKKKYDALEEERKRRKEQQDRLGAFIATMEHTQTVPVAFDADLWLATVDRVTVHKDTVVFTFKGGMEITENI